MLTDVPIDPAGNILAVTTWNFHQAAVMEDPLFPTPREVVGQVEP